MKTLGYLSLIFTATLLVVLSSPDSARADYDCGDFASQAEAQDYLLPGDPHGLDADSDGIACESNPCPCSSGSSGGSGGSEESEPAAPPPYRLKKSVARRAAKRLVKRFVARSRSVDSITFGPCRRRSERRVNCFATALGETTVKATTCQLRVAVRAVNRQPQASLAARRCRARPTARLTAARAEGAIRDRARELTDVRVAIAELERRNHRLIVGIVEWIERPKPGTRESCFAEIKVEQEPPQGLRTSILEFGCEPAS